MANFTNNVSFMSPDLAVEQKALDRRRQLAQALLLQSQQPVEQQTAGGYVVPINPLQGVAKIAQAYSSALLNKRSDEKEKELINQATSRRAQDFADALKARDGTPAKFIQPDPQEFEQAADQGAESPSGVSIPAKPGSTAAMYARLLQSQDPALQQMGMAGMMKEEESFTLKPGEQRFRGNTRVASLPALPKYHNVNGNLVPEPTAPGMPTSPVYTAPREMKIGPAGQVYDPFNIKPGEVFADPNKPFSVGADGQISPNTAYQNYELTKAAKGATRVNTNVNTERTFLGDVAKNVGDQVGKMPEMARAAVGTIQTVNRIRDAIDSGQVMAGPGTNARVFLGQVGQVLGVSGKDATEKLTQTRNAIQGLAQLELDGAQQMKGQGQITEAERDIIRRAASGDIDRMSVPEISTLMETLDKTARFKIRQNAANVQKLSTNPNAGAVVPFMQVDEPPPYQPRRRASDRVQSPKFLGFEK